MSTPDDYAVLDTTNLLFRHFYGAKGVSWPDRPKAALHAFVRDLPRFGDRFGTLVFAFDVRPYHREKLFPGYKRKGGRSGDEESQALDELHALIKSLGQKHLNAAGFTNVFAQPGFEADDIMSAVRQGLPQGSRCVLVTGDKDVYQLLDARCAVYHPIPDEFVTALTFKVRYGIRPKQWVDVKALAGCDGDKVPGCPKVAEATALKYIREEIPVHHQIYKDIQAFIGCGGVKQNRDLVELPFAGLPPIKPVSQKPLGGMSWQGICDLIGVDGPEDLFPEARRRSVRTVGE